MNLTGSFGRWVFERNGNAVASVLFGVAGLLVFGVILGPIAIGLGVMARSQIRQHAAAGLIQAGSRTAVVGIVVGLVAFLVPVLLLVF